MDKTIAIQVPDSLIAVLEKLADKIPAGGGIYLAAWAPVFAAIVGQLFVFLVQSRGLRLAFENQRKLDAEKERAVAIRKHLEQAYVELLGWQNFVIKEFTVIVNKEEQRGPFHYTKEPPEIGRLRMQFDLLDAQGLLAIFSDIDGRWKKVLGEIIQVLQHPIVGNPQAHPITARYVEFMQGCDSMKMEIGKALSVQLQAV
jgi:hypothetical protein